MATMEQIRGLATERLNELRLEMGQLEKLLARGPRPGRQPSTKKRAARHWSKAQRKAASDRQKARWAKIRAKK